MRTYSTLISGLLATGTSAFSNVNTEDGIRLTQGDLKALLAAEFKKGQADGAASVTEPPAETTTESPTETTTESTVEPCEDGGGGNCFPCRDCEKKNYTCYAYDKCNLSDEECNDVDTYTYDCCFCEEGKYNGCNCFGCHDGSCSTPFGEGSKCGDCDDFIQCYADNDKEECNLSDADCIDKDMYDSDCCYGCKKGEKEEFECYAYDNCNISNEECSDADTYDYDCCGCG